MSIAALPTNLVSLGAPAAERDIERGLEHYFVESDAFRRVLSGETTVVLGNRGAGKSAIFQMLARRSRAKGVRVIELAPDDYSYEMLRRTMHSEEEGSWAKYGAYAAAWKYTLLVLTMKELCKRQVRSQNASEAAIRKYVREHHHHPDMGTLWALTSYLKRLEGFKVGSYEAQLKVKELERLYKLDEIRHLVPHLKAALEDQRVIVIIDELDKGWDSSEDAQAFISGLFQACVSLNRLSPHLRAYISLRQELYDNTPSLYEDAQKYRDLIETICWTEADLQSLIARRLRYSVPRLAEASDARCWRTLFASTMDGEPGGSFRYIVDRTLHRPREMILFSAQACTPRRCAAARCRWTRQRSPSPSWSTHAAAPTTSRPSSGSSTRTCSACSRRSGGCRTRWSAPSWSSSRWRCWPGRWSWGRGHGAGSPTTTRTL